ncbi:MULTISPECIES: hypothetical protein [Nitrosomonas]|uniref:hypothetical protein n=1 Tax=Nitrosomonas TaxID=914 RepID=UPI0023F20BA4|nr:MULTISPECIES: hypothetical protein [Nitrosomonas]
MAASLEERAQGQYRIEYEAFGNISRSSNIATVAGGTITSGAGSLYLFPNTIAPLIDEWSRKLHVLEAFNGQYFFNLPSQKSRGDHADSVPAGCAKPVLAERHRRRE